MRSSSSGQDRLGRGGQTILATGDGGATWAPQTSGTQSDLWAVQFLDAKTGWAVGTSGTILATGDGGATWAPQTSGTLSVLIAVQFLDAMTGWAVGTSGTILATGDGGATWAPQTSGTLSNLSAVQFLDAETGWAVGESGTILATGDGGATWAPRTSGTRSNLLAVQFLDAKTGWAVGDSGTILATGDGGATWAPQTSGTQSHLSAVQFLDAETGWAVGDSGTILATGDGGATWAPQTSGTRSNLYAVQFLDAKTGWAVGNSGQMVKIEAPDVFTYADIASDAALKQALTQMPPDGIVDPAPFLASLEAIEKNRDLETSIRIALQSQITGTEAGGVSVFGQKFDLTLNITRVGLVALILFLVGVFSGLYRYNLRMAAFYDSRADALVMHWSHDSDHTLAELADIFGPDSIEFAKARLPTEHIINLAKQAIKSRAKT